MHKTTSRDQRDATTISNSTSGEAPNDDDLQQQQQLAVIGMDQQVNQEDDECWDDAKEEHDQLQQHNKLQATSTTDNYSTATSHPSSNPIRPPSSSTNISQKQQHTSLKASSDTDTNHNRDDAAVVDLSLHEAIFHNDVSRIYELLKDKQLTKNIINKKDKHGNTPLHLACMLGRSKEIVSALLECGATVDVKNLHRWTPFHEACSYGNRDIIRLLTLQIKDDVTEALNKNEKFFSENLEKTKNYRLVLKWEFQSWIPFLTRVLPSDVCVITKHGNHIRIDTSILDLEMFSQNKKRGDSCLIFSPKFEKKWIIVNNRLKKFQHLETQNMDRDIEDKIDQFMSNDIMDFELKSADIQLTRSTCGWIWKTDRMEKVSRYSTAVYNFNNVFLVTRKRREHLSEKDLKRNKLAYKCVMHVLKFGDKPNLRDLEDASNQGYDGGADDNSNDENNRNDNNQEDIDEPETQHRESLLPPPSSNVTWFEYCQAEAGDFPPLGREPKCKTVKTAFKASVAMAEEFPITKEEFLDLLSIVPLKLFKKLKDFIEMRLPEGFPMRLDVPVFPFLTARITFEDFAFIDGPVNSTLFSIPPDYEEDPNLFKGSKFGSTQ